ncbi:MAG: hypothetical protein CMJ18_21575 [Phycisphaeraceae bacterium]|nr:hypothetical protein [Phycisphaeraceae bacterium]
MGDASKSTSGGRLRHFWDRLSIRWKINGLIVATAVAGGAVGVLDATTGHHVWPLSVGLTAVGAAGILLAQRWVVRPFDSVFDYLSRFEQVDEHERRDLVRSFDVQREDEIGRLARMARQIMTDHTRGRMESDRLRRTIDDRVARATRVATSKLHRQSRRDPMTDLENRRHLDERLEPLVAKLRDERQDLFCVLIDMDNFKQINDTCGHQVGDEMIVLLGQMIRAAVRRDDIAVRLGGDEFVVLMPRCSKDRVVVGVVEQIRHLYRQQIETMLPHSAIDLSIGVASLLRDRPETGRQLLEMADQNLYEAKRNGKGQIVGIA